MEFVQLNKNDLDYVLDLLRLSAVWLNENNIDYWQDWHNPEEIYVDWIQSGLNENQFYKVVDNNNTIGIFRLQYEDAAFWGERNDKAGYIHSFTVNRDLAGLGYGYRILNMIKDLLIENNIDFFRLDCGKEVTKLRDYYINYGFSEIGEISLNGHNLVLFELIL